MLSCIQFCNSMDCSPPGFTVRRILQARILEWTAISFSRGSSQSRDQTWVSHVTGGCFTIWAIREAPCMVGVCLIFFFFYFTILYWFCHTSTWIHHKTVFQSGYSNLHSPSAMHESFYCHMFSPAFIVTVLDFGHSNSYVMVSHFCFYLHFSGDNWYEATFHILFANLYISSLVRYLLKNLTHFVMGLFIFFLLFCFG